MFVDSLVVLADKSCVLLVNLYAFVMDLFEYGFYCYRDEEGSRKKCHKENNFFLTFLR